MKASITIDISLLIKNMNAYTILRLDITYTIKQIHQLITNQ